MEISSFVKYSQPSDQNQRLKWPRLLSHSVKSQHIHILTLASSFRDVAGAPEIAVVPRNRLKSKILNCRIDFEAGNSPFTYHIESQLQDYGRIPAAELELKFSLSKVTLEPMLRFMAYISEQLSTLANKVAVINLKLQDTEITTGESEVKFQVSSDTLGAMLRSMAYIREQL